MPEQFASLRNGAVAEINEYKPVRVGATTTYNHKNGLPSNVMLFFSLRSLRGRMLLSLSPRTMHGAICLALSPGPNTEYLDARHCVCVRVCVPCCALYACVCDRARLPRSHRSGSPSFSFSSILCFVSHALLFIESNLMCGVVVLRDHIRHWRAFISLCHSLFLLECLCMCVFRVSISFSLASVCAYKRLSASIKLAITAHRSPFGILLILCLYVLDSTRFLISNM